MDVLIHKRGSTFSKHCRYEVKQANGQYQPQDLTDVTIKSQIRSSDFRLITELTASKYDQSTNTGEFVLSAGSTWLWPITQAIWDIMYIKNDVVTHTETRTIKIERSVTQNAS